MAPESMSADPAYLHHVENLRDHVDQRFSQLNQWLESINDTLKKLADQRDRIVILEQNQLYTAADRLDLHKQVDALREDQKTQWKDVIKLTAIGGSLAAVAIAVLPLLIEHWLTK
jgi:CHASE3 domain sensor protein